MTYGDIVLGRFISRPNRFIAHVEIDGEDRVCHVKNTGRCKELLLPGARVVLEHCPSPSRKTEHDLIAVWKGDMLINMDAQAPNKVFYEWLSAGGLGYIPDAIRPEVTHGDSRFDLYMSREGREAFIEVKGVTLEDNGLVRFPDAPTLRGVKHLRGLMDCVRQGYEAWAVFVIQMEGPRLFTPAWDKHRDFGLALKEAREAGVHVLALDCHVEPDSLEIRGPVPIDLSLPEDI